jgi:hypothetical protein
MGKINKYNYYSYQDLSLAGPVIVRMLLKKRRLKTIFFFLRNEARWEAIGDYPLISYVCRVVNENGRTVKPKEVSSILRKTKEFKKIRQHNEFIVQVCGQNTTQNALQLKKKVEMTKDTI